MYYLFLKHGTDFHYPTSLIVEYADRYFIRQASTDWSLMDENEKEALLSGKDSRYYAVDPMTADEILDRWGGSKNGYRHLNVDHKVKTCNYGESYDELD